jgi:hypothetical protein
VTFYNLGSGVPAMNQAISLDDSDDTRLLDYNMP